MKFERNEYPRPQFRRDIWQSLNGEWEFAFDDEDNGEELGYFFGLKHLDGKINVPFVFQYEASGVGDKSLHEVVWYRRTFKVCAEGTGKRALLCFNGVDYEADVWVNGMHAVSHKGAYAPFFADVRAKDPYEADFPRGKQSWTGNPFKCWYIPSTGIWQSVWIEFFGDDCIQSYTLQSDYDNTAFGGDISTMYGRADRLEIIAKLNGREIRRQSISLQEKFTKYRVQLSKIFNEEYRWSPENPQLIFVDILLYKGGVCIDTAHTRFGMRKISVDENGRICLNGRPYYQRLVLDQGYWSKSGITPPSAEDLKKDIELAKAMGFNGARKHQKAEDPYYCYFAEELGFLTWCEMPSAYRFNAQSARAIMNEWQEMLSTAKNCTSNICYVLLNESWGVRDIRTDNEQKAFARALYYMTKSIDGEKLISTNDGFETINPTEILGIHDYDLNEIEKFRKYENERYNGMYPQGWALFADGETYAGEPVLLTEFGGIAMKRDESGVAWGYNKGAESEDELLQRLQELMRGIVGTKFQGFCYTQLTDVQQEVNGLLTVDRIPKADLYRLNKIFSETDKI